MHTVLSKNLAAEAMERTYISSLLQTWYESRDAILHFVRSLVCEGDCENGGARNSLRLPSPWVPAF